MKVFISYSTKDQSVAEDILAAIESDSNIECFYAPRDIRTGHVYAEEIMVNLENSDALVLVLSQYSNDSQHVLREVERAVSNNIPIISYPISDVVLSPSMKYFLMSNQWLDSREDADRVKLIEAINSLGEDENAPQVSKAGGKEKSSPKKNSRKFNWKLFSIIMVIVWLVTICIIALPKISGKSEDKNSELIVEPEASENKRVFEIGETITFGTYMSNPIEWRVVDVDEAGILTLISSNILCMKGFEGAESGRVFYTKSGETKDADRPFNPIENMEAFGSNDWENSSIRAWLNSSRENVEYTGTVPIAKVMCDGDNPYNAESGFLRGFSEEERNKIVLTTLETPYYDPDTAVMSVKKTEDYVFVPSMDEVTALKDADISLYCEPTQQAIEADGSTLYKYYCKVFGDSTHVWWLRTPVEDSFSELYCVYIGYNGKEFDENVAAVGGVGIRPMLRVDGNEFE